MNSPVEILLSTYNGEKYLAAQLDSIIQQNYPHWKLLVRDDGSSDKTVLILDSYIQKYPDKITLLNDNDGNIGYSNSFSKLLRQSSADYVMYCDQDDYWHTDKISTMLSVMLEEEGKWHRTAHLVFSDLQMADSELKVTSQSFLKMMRYSSRMNARVFFLKNYIPGCAMLFNRMLISQALKTNNIINLHDQWLMMVCSSVGKITCVSKPLIRYRLHDNNAIGFIEQHATFFKRFLVFLKDILKYVLANKKYRHLLCTLNIQQVQNICQRLENVSKEAIQFSRIDKSNYFSRKIRNIFRPYIREKHFLKQITYIICF